MGNVFVRSISRPPPQRRQARAVGTLPIHGGGWVGARAGGVFPTRAGGVGSLPRRVAEVPRHPSCGVAVQAWAVLPLRYSSRPALTRWRLSCFPTCIAFFSCFPNMRHWRARPQGSSLPPLHRPATPHPPPAPRCRRKREVSPPLPPLQPGCVSDTPKPEVPCQVTPQLPAAPPHLAEWATRHSGSSLLQGAQPAAAKCAATFGPPRGPESLPTDGWPPERGGGWGFGSAPAAPPRRVGGGSAGDSSSGGGRRVPCRRSEAGSSTE